MNPALWPYLAGTTLVYPFIGAWWKALELTGRGLEEHRQKMGFHRTGSGRTGQRTIWIQAVSVGEVRLAVGFLDELRRRRPELGLILSTGTRTGQAEARRLAGDFCRVVYFPLDTLPGVRRALATLRPELFVLVETELWPIFLARALESGVKVALVNGRISDRTARAYRFLAPVFRPLLGRFSRVAAVGDRDAVRLARLGAREERLLVLGNAKKDGLSLQADPEGAEELGRRLGLTGRPVWVAGSVRSAEEEAVISAFGRVRRSLPRAVLAIAPRHLERVPALIGRLEEAGLDYFRRSGLDNGRSPKGKEPRSSVVILDTLGELFSLYRAGKVAFVGGGLAPLGGHNPLEPAFWEKPVLMGPHMGHFGEPAGKLIHAGGAAQVADEKELAHKVTELLGDDELRKRMGRAAGRVCRQKDGAFERTVELILAALEDEAPGRPHQNRRLN